MWGGVGVGRGWSGVARNFHDYCCSHFSFFSLALIFLYLKIFPTEICSQPCSYNLHGEMFSIPTSSILDRCLCDRYAGLEVALLRSAPYKCVCSPLYGSLY